MTPEAQRIAIAEAWGYTVEESRRDQEFPFFLTKKGIRQGVNWRTASGAWSHGIPDYLNDLNAMHEAEKVLTRAQQFVYSDLIRKLNPCDLDFEWHCPAAQRAEAFLRTLGLWKD
jgi:hypothetical protein